MTHNFQKIAASDLLAHPDAIILDVRTGAEHRGEKLACAHAHIPIDELDAAAFVRNYHLDGSRPVYLLCRSGARAARAAQMFADAGFHNVGVIEGGIVACQSCGVSVHAGAAVIPLERQVRIAAGALVVGGVLLGTLVAPGFYALSAFVGAGLIFAGVTDWCGMALLLARAPWNR